MKHPQKISKLIFGLGNPGDKYSKNRHNVGKMFIEYLQKNQFKVQSKSSMVAGTYFIAKNSQDQHVAFYQSPSYMNLSGIPFKAAFKQCKLKSMDDVIIVHDDLDTKTGKSKVKVGGSPEGHNGLKSIISQMGTKDFLRLKIGIDRPESHEPAQVASYVLKNFTSEQIQLLHEKSYPIAIDLLKARKFL